MKIRSLVLTSLASAFVLIPTPAHHVKPIDGGSAGLIGLKTTVLKSLPAMPAPAVQTISTLDPVYIPPAPQNPTSHNNYSSVTLSVCGDNSYANYIYSHESGCQLYNPNPGSGACGLGQAWPCSKLEAACPAMDYACENSYFNGYASRYGGWAGAYSFWLANRWW